MRSAFCDVTARDGLQTASRVLDADVRSELISRLVGAGVHRVEAVSFVNPSVVPTMADAERVANALGPLPDVIYSGLVLNERGYDRLRATPLSEVRVVIACTESFSRHNANVSADEAMSTTGRILSRARLDGIRGSVILAVAFGCPYEGDVATTRVLDVAEQLVAFRPDELILADTIGIATPKRVREVVSAASPLGVELGVHLHGTPRGGVTNTLLALEVGATSFDAALGGLGGCPFAPGAKGNADAYDVLAALAASGVEIGIDLEELQATWQWLKTQLGGVTSAAV